jgi:hypothetical protein
MIDFPSRTIAERLLDGCFAVRGGVLGASRLPTMAAVGRRVSVAEVLLLLLCGSASACAIGYVRLGLGIPGHAIVLTALPMAFGLALAPRRMAGSVMSAGAFGTATVLTAFAGARYGGGTFVSLCLLGPMMDVALAGTRRAWRLYLGLVVAGVATNLLAFTSRGGAKLFGLDLPGTRPFATWWSQALLTYTLSGAVAGLLAALFWFRLRERRVQQGEPEPRG